MSISDAGAAISSEQSGEMLHSHLQKMWNLTFKTREANQVVNYAIQDCSLFWTMDCLKSEFIDVQMLDIETTVSLMFGLLISTLL